MKKKKSPGRKRKSTSTAVAAPYRSLLSSARGTAARTSQARIGQAIRNKLRAIQARVKDPVERRKLMTKAIKYAGRGAISLGLTTGTGFLIEHLVNGGELNSQDVKDVTRNAGYAVMQDALSGKKVSPAKVRMTVLSETRKTLANKRARARKGAALAGPRRASKKGKTLSMKQLEKLFENRVRNYNRKTTSRGNVHRIVARGGKKKKKKTFPRDLFD